MHEFLYCLYGLLVRNVRICTDNLKHGMKMIVNRKKIFNRQIVAGNPRICDIARGNQCRNMLDSLSVQLCFYLRSRFQYLRQIGQPFGNYFQLILHQNIMNPCRKIWNGHPLLHQVGDDNFGLFFACDVGRNHIVCTGQHIALQTRLPISQNIFFIWNAYILPPVFYAFAILCIRHTRFFPNGIQRFFHMVAVLIFKMVKNCYKRSREPYWRIKSRDTLCERA